MLLQAQLAKVLISLGHMVKEGEITPESILQGIKSFQEFYGLKVDGDYGRVTERTLLTRLQLGCGCPDIMKAGTSLCKWPMNTVSYFVASTPNGISADDAKQAYRRAWDSWEKVCGLKAVEVTSAKLANVVMQTGRGQRAGFDGPMGVLAWSQLPCGASKTTQLVQQYDLDEKWGISTSGGAILLENVACHEIGHAIGLDHIKANLGTALMNPIYSPNVPRPLPLDIAEVVERYGQPSPKTPDPTPTPTPTPPLKRIVIQVPAGLGIDAVSINGRDVPV